MTIPFPSDNSDAASEISSDVTMLPVTKDGLLVEFRVFIPHELVDMTWDGAEFGQVFESWIKEKQVALRNAVRAGAMSRVRSEHQRPVRRR